MFAFLLQDWTTIRASSAATITQTEPFWLDMSRYLDLVAFMQVSEVTATGGSLYMAYETAPTKDESLFVPMNDVSSAGVAMSVGVLVAVLLRDTALCPLCHWLRWQLSPGAGVTAYDATFRLWISASRPGALVDATTSDSSVMNSGFEGDPAWTYGPTVGGSAPAAPTKSSSSSTTTWQPFPQNPTRTNPAIGVAQRPWVYNPQAAIGLALPKPSREGLAVHIPNNNTGLIASVPAGAKVK